MAKAQEPAIAEKKISDADVMGAMQGAMPSQTGDMDIMSIIKQAFESKNMGFPYNQFVKVLGGMLQDENNSLIKIGNVAFFVQRTPQDKKKVKFAVFSGVNPSLLPKNILGFYKFLKNQGILSAETSEDSKQIAEAFKTSGAPVKMAQGMERRGKTMAPTYKISFDMGSKK